MVRLAQQSASSIELTKAPDVLNVAVIGCGYWGPNLVRNFFEASTSTVTYACDMREDRLAAISKRYPTITCTTDHREVLRDPNVDAVAIATHVSTHYDLVREALEAGKHVWIEKPLVLTHVEAQRLTELAARRKLTLMVDHTFVYTPAVQRMRQSVESGELGDLLYYDSVRVNLGLYQHDVNVIWDLGIHDIAIMDYLLPFRPVAVSATAASQIGNGGSESIAYVSLQFEENFLAHFHVNWLAPVKIRLATLCGASKMIVYDDTVPSEKVLIYDRGVKVNGSDAERTRMLVEYRTGDMYAPKLEQTEALQIAARHFAESIFNETAPITDGEAGSRTVAILEAAQHSLMDGGALTRIG